MIRYPDQTGVQAGRRLVGHCEAHGKAASPSYLPSTNSTVGSVSSYSHRCRQVSWGALDCSQSHRSVLTSVSPCERRVAGSSGALDEFRVSPPLQLGLSHRLGFRFP